MNNDLKEMYKDIENKNIDDFNVLRDYCINLLKKNNILDFNQELNDINEYKENILKNGESCNIRSLWYFIEKKYNKNMSWIEHPLIFTFNNELKLLENDLTFKANEINEEYNEYYYKSCFFSELKKQLVELLKIHKTGLNINEIYNQFDIEKINIDRALDLLIQEKIIKKLEGSNPATYYL